MEDGQPIAIGSAPRDAKDVEVWLRSFPSWVEDLQGAGYYGVQPDLGTRVQSNREGRPTERAAILLASLLERVRTVAQWLNWLEELAPLQRRLADHYVQRVPITKLAEERGLGYDEVWGTVKLLPESIWSKWYS